MLDTRGCLGLGCSWDSCDLGLMLLDDIVLVLELSSQLLDQILQCCKVVKGVLRIGLCHVVQGLWDRAPGSWV